jgi:hypothetical protein
METKGKQKEYQWNKIMENKEQKKRHIISYESFEEHNASTKLALFMKDYKAKQKQENRDKKIDEILK